MALREAPVSWARELAAALDLHGIPYDLEPSPAVRGSEEPACRILVAQSDLPRAMAVDDDVYARQVPGPAPGAEGQGEWSDLLAGSDDDETPVTGRAARAALIRAIALMLAMLLYYVIRALLSD